MSNIVICDGSNLYYRAFYSMSEPLQNADGQDTTAIYNFLKGLRTIIEQENPEETYVVFDFGRDVRKKEIHKDYKANRNIDLSVLSGYVLTIKMNEIESKKRQRDVIIDMLKTLPVKLLILHQIEGDSLMAYVARHFSNLGKTVTIVSNDQDFYQLLDFQGITIWNPHKKARITKENYKEHMKVKGIELGSMRLMKSILGDASDNIDGIKGLGEGRTSQLFAMTGPMTKVEDVAKALDNPVIMKKFGKYFIGKEELLKRNYELVDLIETKFSPQSLISIFKAIESKPSYCKMSFAQLLIKENINTILNNLDAYMIPFNKMLKDNK